MSDQIILEFIGDPSGLKPAEEALKGLSKTSQETIEAFNKANEAAKKFAESTKHISTSVKDVGEATTKSVGSISSLSKVISGGAIKEIITDFKNWAKDVSALTGQKEKLEAKLKSVQTVMAKVKTEVSGSEKQYKSLTKEAGGFEKQIKKNTTEQDKETAAAAKASAEIEKQKTKLSESQQKLAAMNGTKAESTKKYKELSESIGKTDEKLKKAEAAYTAHTAKSKELGNSNDELKGKLAGVKTEMGNVSTNITSGKEKYTQLSGEAKKLQTAIGSNTKEIDTSNKGFAAHSKAVQQSMKSVSSLISNSKKLVTHMGDVAAALALATGNEKEAAAIHEKTNQVLTVLSATQSAVSSATTALSTATDTASAASKAFGMAAKGAWAEATMGILPVIQGVIALIQNFDDIKKKVLALFPALKALFGIKDIQDNTAAIKKNIEQHDKTAKALRDKVALLESEGASVKQINETRMAASRAEYKSLLDQISLQREKTLAITDEKKKKEELIKLEDLRAKAVTKFNDIVKEGVTAIQQNAQENERLGKSEKEILKIKEDQIKAEVSSLQNKKLSLNLIQQEKNEIDAQLKAYNNMLAETTAAQKKNASEAAESAASKRKEANDIKKSEELKMLELKLSLAKKGSEEELKLQKEKLALAEKAEEDSSKVAGTAKETYKKLLHQKLLEDEKIVDANHNTEILKKEKEQLQISLQEGIKSAEDLHKIKIDILNKEQKLIESDINMSKVAQMDALTELNKKREELNKEAPSGSDEKIQENLKGQKDADKEELESKIETIDQKLKAEKKYSIAAIQLQKDKLADIMQMAIDEVVGSTISEAEKAIKLKAIHKQYTKDCKKIDEDADKDKKAREDAAAKKQQEIAKEVAKKLIEIAKDVSDAIFENQKQQRDNDLKQHLDTLNEQKDAELLNTTLTASQRKAIEKKYKIEEAQEKQRAWKADQKAKAEQAIINGLLALTMSLAQQGYPAGLVTGLLALAQAGVQAGIIMSKTPPKFAKGVVALDGPGTETSDSIHAMLSRGESVITAKATSKYKPMLEAMNAGTFMPYMPVPQMPDVSTHMAHTSVLHSRPEIDYDKLSEAFARKINTKQLHVNIDEKGFTKSIISKGNRVESYNDKMKF